MHRYGVRFAALLAVLAVGLTACGGGSETVSPGSSTAASSEASSAESMQPSAAESMEESTAPSAIDLGGAAGDISDLSSYQVDIAVTGGSSGDQQMTIISQADPAATHYIMDDFELISIDGQGAWIKQGDTWIAAPGPVDAYASAFDALAPDTLIGAYGLGLYGSRFQDSGSEEHNGVDTTHYHLDASDAAGVPGSTFPDDGTIDVWIANEGGYLVGMQYGGTDPDTGDQVQFNIEVSHVNDASISIEPPI